MILIDHLDVLVQKAVDEVEGSGREDVRHSGIDVRVVAAVKGVVEIFERLAWE